MEKRRGANWLGWVERAGVNYSVAGDGRRRVLDRGQDLGSHRCSMPWLRHLGSLSCSPGNSTQLVGLSQGPGESSTSPHMTQLVGAAIWAARQAQPLFELSLPREAGQGGEEDEQVSNVWGLAHKAEHAVDPETGAVVGVTLQPADRGDTSSLFPTAAETGENVREVTEDEDAPKDAESQGTQELVADKGYHSNETCRDLREAGVRTYISEPDRPRRDWQGKAEEQAAVYGNRRRIRGRRGRALLRRRGEFLERSFAHGYETGGMRRTHLRGHPNILKRLLIHVAGFNMGLVMRRIFGIGKPRRLQDGLAAAALACFSLVELLWGHLAALRTHWSWLWRVPGTPA